MLHRQRPIGTCINMYGYILNVVFILKNIEIHKRISGKSHLDFEN